ncbi:hypothetical protein LTR42_002543 [Elasticomyces elasticus]|nr:hypothetical protein LTR42_002543 [Elasticomyces elasticus]
MGPMEDFVRQAHDKLITVRVGSGEGLRDFKIPKALLCARIAWFDSALRDERFLEGNTGIVTLPEDDPSIFVAVHYYIYNQTLSFAQVPKREGESTRAEQITYCIRVWILGHKYCMVGLQNCAMQRACLLLKEGDEEHMLDNATLKACFSCTVDGSPLHHGEFNTVFACSDGATVEELFDAQDDLNEKDYDFPRYQSPLRYKDEMLITSDKVTVEVGSGDHRRSFTVPKGLLCTIVWFERALQSNTFREGAEGKITLPEDNAAAFGVFQFWLYHNELHFEHISYDEDPKTDLGRELEYCVASWIFGHKYGVTRLQNAVMARICDILKTKELLLSLESVTACYAQTLPGSPLRRMAAEALVFQMSEKKIDIGNSERVSKHGGFLADVLNTQNFRHEVEGDFPRYAKPLKFKALFYVDEDPSVIDTTDTTDTLDGLWTLVKSPDCEDCWFYNADVACEECMPDGDIVGWPCVHNATNRKCGTCA